MAEDSSPIIPPHSDLGGDVLIATSATSALHLIPRLGVVPDPQDYVGGPCGPMKLVCLINQVKIQSLHGYPHLLDEVKSKAFKREEACGLVESGVGQGAARQAASGTVTAGRCLALPALMQRRPQNHVPPGVLSHFL